MHKTMLLAAAVAAGTLAVSYAVAQDVAHPPAEQEGTDSQQVQQQGSEEEGMQVTGMVTAADQQTQKITIGDQTFVMPKEGGGAELFPQVGSEVIALLQGGRRPKGDHANWAKTAVAKTAGRRSEMATVARTPLWAMVYLWSSVPSYAALIRQPIVVVDPSIPVTAAPFWALIRSKIGAPLSVSSSKSTT